jgi:hypothetical protein
MGLGPSLPPTKLARRDSTLFCGSKTPIFHYARGTTNVKGRSDAVARPVTIDQTRPVMSGSLLESTGRWYFGIRSVQAVRPVAWSKTRNVATGR